MTTLVACSHGTRSPVGRQVVAAIVEAVRAELPDVDVRPAFVDVEEPRLADALPGLHGPVVVVPVFLSGGYHLHHDIHRAAGHHHDAGADPRWASLGGWGPGSSAEVVEPDVSRPYNRSGPAQGEEVSR